MDFEVHRLRIGNWKPDAIKSAACDDKFTHNLAIGKENGEIEVVDPVDNFALLLSVAGRDDFRLQALTWSKFVSEHGRNRLFGISLKGFLFEVDLHVGAIVHVTDCFSSAVWTLAACPRSDTLAIGCEDGVVRLFEFGHHRRAPEYYKSLTTSGARVLCLAYHQSLPKLVLGSSDGVIRVLDETSGRVLQRLSATTPVGQSCCLWSLALLSDETIVTGDSNGRVMVWDGLRGVATHCFTQHSADVLALAVSRDETQLFAAGVDGKVVSLRRNNNNSANGNHSNNNNSNNSWQYTHSHRSHTHDVFCLALCATATHQRQLPGVLQRKRKRTVGDLGILGSTQSLGEAGVLGQYSGYHSGDCLVSGGLDAKLCVYAVQDFAKLRPLYLPFLPQGQDAVQHDDHYTLLALKQGRHIDLWLSHLDLQSSLGNTSNGNNHHNSTTSSSDNNDTGSRVPEWALRVSVRGPEHVSCVALSPCGSLLVCATAPTSSQTSVGSLDSTNNSSTLHLWQLYRSESAVTVRAKVALPATLSLGHVTALAFKPSTHPNNNSEHSQNNNNHHKAELAVYDGHTQRLWLLHFSTASAGGSGQWVCAVHTSFDCASDVPHTTAPTATNNTGNNYHNTHHSSHHRSRSIAGGAPRTLKYSPCGHYICCTGATKYLENHLTAVAPNTLNNAANNNGNISSNNSNSGAVANNNNSNINKSDYSISSTIAVNGSAVEDVLRIVSSHSVTVLDLHSTAAASSNHHRVSVTQRLRNLASAAVDLSFFHYHNNNNNTATSSATNVPHVLVLQQNGVLRAYDLVQRKLISLPCATPHGHTPASEVKLPHRLRFPLQHLAVQQQLQLTPSTSTSGTPPSTSTASSVFVYGQMQSVYLQLSEAQPETPRIVQPSYLMTPQQIHLQQTLAHELAQKSGTHRVLQHAIAIGSGASAVVHLTTGSDKNANQAEDSNNEDNNSSNNNGGSKKRKVQFEGKTTAAAEATTTAVIAIQTTTNNNNNNNNSAHVSDNSSSSNACLVDVYRNVLHLGFLSVSLSSPRHQTSGSANTHTSEETSSTTTVSTTSKKSKKDANNNNNSNSNSSVVVSPTQYKQVLILVENPWARIAESLPETVSRKRYGT